MVLLNILIASLLALTVPVSRYECNSRNIFSIAEGVSSSEKSAVLLVKDNINLNGRTLTLTDNVIVVMEGGSFSNGYIKGNHTTLSAVAYPIFDDDLRVSGTWITDNAYAEWFGQTGTSDDTKTIQKCLDTFFQCHLLNKQYNITSISIPDNASLAGNDQGRYRMPTIHQIESYNGDLITTGNKAFSGISISGFRITGGNEFNTAVRITVPNSKLNSIFIDEYLGSGINLYERAWGIKISHCSVFGNILNASKKKAHGIAILINTNGGLISIEHYDINYFQTGIQITKGTQVTIRGCSISECSRNQLKNTDACIKIDGGNNIIINDNYLENFSTGIAVEGGKAIEIFNNYVNGLSVASFGIDLNGMVEKKNKRQPYLYGL